MKSIRYIPFIASLLLFGCASGPSGPTPGWVIFSKKDDFTDTRFTMVTVGSLYLKNNVVLTNSGTTYPFVGYIDGELLVGVRSGGKFRIPVGNIQLRIDEHDAWTIMTSETPTDLMGIPTSALPPIEGLTPDMAAAVEGTQKMMSGMISPFTATTGEKAQAILKQMLSGNVLKYRSVGFNQQTSTTGEVELDSSLRESLIQAGIPLPE